MEYFLKSEEISLDIEDREGITYSYFNIRYLYHNKDDKQKAESYFIIAGYIAKTLEMKHELSEWSWALNPLIEEMGEERFMEEGKRLLEERGIV